jgi:hypothetical protein
VIRGAPRVPPLVRAAALAAACLTAGAALPAPARADAVRCRARIARESAYHVQTRMKALASCEELVLKGKRQGPCPDAIALESLAAAESKLRTRIARDCGGDGRVCGDGDDEPLADIGWDAGTCPDLDGAGCADPIADCGDVAACLACAGARAVEQLVAVSHDELAPTEPRTPLNSCQLRINKETLRFFRAKSKALQKCWDAVSRGLPGPCPVPGDGKAALKIARAESFMVARICRRCGGRDGVCGGDDDFGPATIGFPAACPDLSLPGGPSCAGPVETLQSLVDCLACVSDARVECVDALAVPWARPYPAECNP